MVFVFVVVLLLVVAFCREVVVCLWDLCGWWGFVLFSNLSC